MSNFFFNSGFFTAPTTAAPEGQTVNAVQPQISNFGNLNLPGGQTATQFLGAHPNNVIAFNTNGLETVGDLQSAIGATGAGITSYSSGAVDPDFAPSAVTILAGSYVVSKNGTNAILIQK